MRFHRLTRRNVLAGTGALIATMSVFAQTGASPPTVSRAGLAGGNPPAVALPTAASAPPEQRILVQAWAETETVISSPLVGLVLQIPTRPGARFEKDEVLIRYECTENEARAQIAVSEHTAASETLAAKIRLQSMSAASEIEVVVAAAQVSKAEAQVKLAEHQAKQCRVLAPFDGYVVRSIGKPFQTTTVGQPMLEVITAGTPKLRVSADSRLFSRFRVGTSLRVTIDETGQSYNARVTLINARIDPVNQAFEMEARVQGSAPGLLPGMSGSATLIATDPPADPNTDRLPPGSGARR